LCHIICRDTRCALDTTIRNGPHENLDMFLKRVQIAHTVLDELRADQLSGSVPESSVSGEDTVAKEFTPVLVERLALSIVSKLRSKNRLDVLDVGGHNDTLACGTSVDGPAALAIIRKDFTPAFEIGMVNGIVDGFDDQVET